MTAPFSQSTFPINETPLSDGGNYLTTIGSGLNTNGSGKIVSTSTTCTYLNPTVRSFGRIGFVRGTFDYVSGAIGVMLFNPSGSGSQSGGIAIFANNSGNIIVRSFNGANSLGIYTNLDTSNAITTTGGAQIGIEVVEHATPDLATWNLYNGDTLFATGTFTFHDSITQLQPAFFGNGAGDGLTAIYAADSFSVPLEIDTDPTSIERGTEFSVSVSNASADDLLVGAFSATLGGEVVDITSFTNDTGNTYTLGITVPLDVNLKHSATGYPLVITEDSVDATSAGNIPFTPQSGFSYVNLVDPDFTDDTVFDLGGDAPVTGDQVVYTTVTTPSSKDFSVTDKGYGVIDYGEDAVTAESVQLYIVLNDGTYVSPIRTLEFNLTTVVGGEGLGGLLIPLHRKLLKDLKRPLQRKLH